MMRRPDASQPPGRLFAAIGRLGYDQFTQEGGGDAVRVARPDPAEALVHEVSLRGKNATFSLFATDLIELTPRTHLALAGRWNTTRVRNELRHPSRLIGEAFTYSKFNPAAGATHALGDRRGVFANVSQGTRVPTGESLEPPRFVAPGAARSIVAGVRYEWG